jgi:protein-S-isoprenylcysteine O-methyltransferase Ste14
MVKLVIFIVLSIGLVIWSWKSLSNPRVHGFYRFFTFESILGLIIVNANTWFNNPLFVTQIISWILLLVSMFMAASGFYLLLNIGRPIQGIERTTTLVKTGIYKFIRHPLYSSLILLAWGAFLKDVSFQALVLAIIASICSVTTAIVEEKENLQRFGIEYASYLESTKRFLPFLV